MTFIPETRKFSLKSMVVKKIISFRVSKFVVENVFNNSHIEYNNECDNNDNKNDNDIFFSVLFSLFLLQQFEKNHQFQTNYEKNHYFFAKN